VEATNACGNTQLCAGLQSGIEANLHAVQAIWPQFAGWSEELDGKDGNPLCDEVLWRRVHADGMADPTVDLGAAEDDHHSSYEWGPGFGSALFDARNGFNKLNRYLMLWNIAHLWNHGSQFAFNRYRHWVRCLVRSEPGTQAILIRSKEGITQNDCLAMSLNGVALMPLVSKMCNAIPEALQLWYCNDADAAGKAVPNAQRLDFLVKFGPTYGYFPEPSKYSRGQRYLGGFMGSAKTKEKWLVDLVVKWVGAVETLSKVAERYLRLHALASPSVCRMSGNMSSKLSLTLPRSYHLLRRQSARASCRLSLVSHH